MTTHEPKPTAERSGDSPGATGRLAAPGGMGSLNKEQSAMLARKLTGSRSSPFRTKAAKSTHGTDQSALRPSAFRFPLSAFRPAFTLIELLVAIVIIAILAALLLPAIQGARRNAQEARVIVEIKSLEQAIAAFKVKYGVEPPSLFKIHLTETGWNNDLEMKAIVRRIWPQFEFKMNAGSPPVANAAYPTAWDTAATSQGHAEYVGINAGECLLFFLGGVYDTTTGAPTGFAKNPAYPFAPRSAVANREGPFMEFDAGRIIDSDNSKMFEYLDSLPNQNKPFLYFSSYEGRGYKSNEVTALGLGDVYRVSKSTATPGPGTQSFAAHKAQTFQIISPGMDNAYGKGGVFNPSLPIAAGLQDRADYDNLTNFHSGRLNP